MINIIGQKQSPKSSTFLTITSIWSSKSNVGYFLLIFVMCYWFVLTKRKSFVNDWRTNKYFCAATRENCWEKIRENNVGVKIGGNKVRRMINIISPESSTFHFKLKLTEIKLFWFPLKTLIETFIFYCYIYQLQSPKIILYDTTTNWCWDVIYLISSDF